MTEIVRLIAYDWKVKL